MIYYKLNDQLWNQVLKTTSFYLSILQKCWNSNASKVGTTRNVIDSTLSSRRDGLRLQILPKRSYLSKTLHSDTWYGRMRFHCVVALRPSIDLSITWRKKQLVKLQPHHCIRNAPREESNAHQYFFEDSTKMRDRRSIIHPLSSNAWNEYYIQITH